MKKDIKDYLHLYLGCEYRYRYIDYQTDQWVVWVKLTHERLYRVLNDHSISQIQLALRPLSDMTEEERMWWWNNLNNGRNEVFDEAEWVTELNGKPCEGHWTLWTGNIEYGRLGYTIGINNHFTQNQFVWLLSKGFDLFGLIEAGLAIDKTKI